MLDIFVDLHQYKKIGDAAAKAQSASDKVESVNDYIKRLETEISELKLIMQSMAEILLDKNVCIKEDLINKIKEVDARDGHIDGKISSNGNSKCDLCGRPFNIKINKCQYCGNSKEISPTVMSDYRKNIKKP